MRTVALATFLGGLTYQHPFAFFVTLLVVSVVADWTVSSRGDARARVLADVEEVLR